MRYHGFFTSEDLSTGGVEVTSVDLLSAGEGANHKDSFVREPVRTPKVPEKVNHPGKGEAKEVHNQALDLERHRQKPGLGRTITKGGTLDLRPIMPEPAATGPITGLLRWSIVFSS